MLPWSLEEGVWPCTPRLQPSSADSALWLSELRENHFVVLSHQVYGKLLWRPRQTDPAQRRGPWGGSGTTEMGELWRAWQLELATPWPPGTLVRADSVTTLPLLTSPVLSVCDPSTFGLAQVRAAPRHWQKPGQLCRLRGLTSSARVLSSGEGQKPSLRDGGRAAAPAPRPG